MEQQRMLKGITEEDKAMREADDETALTPSSRWKKKLQSMNKVGITKQREKESQSRVNNSRTKRMLSKGKSVRELQPRVQI